MKPSGKGSAPDYKSTKKSAMTRLVRCPGCGEKAAYDESNPFRPFCSNRCKDQDIVSWATESYRVPGEKVNPEGLGPNSEGLGEDDGE